MRVLPHSSLGCRPACMPVSLLGGRSSSMPMDSIHFLQVPLANLPACLDGYRLAMISDIHAGPTVGRDEVRELMQKKKHRTSIIKLQPRPGRSLHVRVLRAVRVLFSSKIFLVGCRRCLSGRLRVHVPQLLPEQALTVIGCQGCWVVGGQTPSMP